MTITSNTAADGRFDAGVIHSLSLGEAALAAGLSLRTLKALTDELEGTPYDLRAPGPATPGPATPGPATPVRYDPERLSTWLLQRRRVHVGRVRDTGRAGTEES